MQGKQGHTSCASQYCLWSICGRKIRKESRNVGLAFYRECAFVVHYNMYADRWVQGIREVGLFQQHMLCYHYSAWGQKLDSGMLLIPVALTDIWYPFIGEESMKLYLLWTYRDRPSPCTSVPTQGRKFHHLNSWELPWSSNSTMPQITSRHKLYMGCICRGLNGTSAGGNL
ncbi:hypothetical protein GQ53DRAFT_226498 [Thozetella sp. PMI_491]|nr:hypothetical protein GQ53DRAFT_226498 [Thozetella sp. PMI_491]